MSVLTVPKPDDRTEWLKARHGFYNASDAGCLYGVHPFKNLGDVVADKLGPEPVDEGQTEAMERGQRLEPFLLQWFGDRHGIEVVTPNVLYVNGRLMATVDGDSDGLPDDEWIEAKTTSQRWDSVPDHVYWQVVAQGAATGRQQCHVVWIDAEMKFKEAVVVPHEDHVADVLDRAQRFMDFIDLGMAPEGVELSTDALLRLYPAPVAGQFVDIDDEQWMAIVRWEQCRQARIAAEKVETEAKDVVARLIAENEGARYDGKLVCTWRANKATERPDWKALEAEMPEVVDKFRRLVPGARVLRATKDLAA